jgi:hypothetical protein
VLDADALAVLEALLEADEAAVDDADEAVALDSDELALLDVDALLEVDVPEPPLPPEPLLAVAVP